MESNHQRFEDSISARSWLVSTFGPWLESLTEAQRAAVLAYKLDAFEPINEALRIGYELDDDSELIVTNLDAALARLTLSQPLVVYRAFSDVVVKTASIGTVVMDWAYYSTSLLRSVAEQLLAQQPVAERVLAEVLLPDGVHAGAPDLVHEWQEAEILLPRASRFRVVDRISPDYLRLEAILR